MNKIAIFFVISAFAVLQTFCEPDGGYTDRCRSIYVRNGYYEPDNYIVPLQEIITYHCESDYVLRGHPKLKCLPGGWDHLPPTCEPKFPSIPCPRQVDQFENGVIEGPDKDTYNAGETLWYLCNENYVLQGEQDVTCLSNGKWSSPPPRCILGIKLCKRRDAPENGNQSPDLDNYQPGQVVAYSCNPPYNLVGKPIAICLPTGFWSYEVPTCQAPTCRDPIAPENGYLEPNLDEYTVGTMVTFNCFMRFKLLGAKKITCLKNGQWSDEEPICRPTGCEPLQAPENGVLDPVKDIYKIGDRIVFDCDENFILNGNRQVVCLESESWSGPVPTCDAQQCPRPVIENGSFEEDQQVYDVNDYVRFTCDEGFTLEGRKMVRCQRNGRWSDSFPVCNRIQCDRPVFENGRLDADKDFYYLNDAVRFTCNPGFVLSGQNILTCVGNNIWTDEFPVCVAVQCERPLFENGELRQDKELYNVGEYVEFICDNGFTLEGNQRLRCLRNGRFSGAIPTCTPNQCIKPILDNGFFEEEKDIYDAGDSVTFYCNDGFVLEGRNVITCQDDSQWSHPFPQCIPILCKRPNILNGGINIIKDYYDVDDMVVFNCDRGFELRGPKKITCGLNGEWFPKFPICVAISCPRPTFDNGILIVDKSFYNVQDTVLFKCNPGFSLVGLRILRCNFDGTWSDDFPTCEPLQCDRPDFPNGFLTVDKEQYDVGDRVKFTCNDGFFLRGSTFLTCGRNGKFAGRIPVCIAVMCDRPFIDNGSFEEDKDQYAVGETVDFECNNNFFLDGVESVTCLSSGEWSNPFPLCRRFTCPTPTIEQGGFRPSRPTYLLNDIVNFFCNSGFSLVGAKRLQCQDRGLWSGPFPTCRPNRCEQPFIEFGSFMEVKPFYNVGDDVVFRCNRGFLLNGAKTITCEQDGQWSDNFPTCRAVQCSRPTVSEGVFFRPSQNSYDVGQVVNFMCTKGSVLVGEKQIRCLNNGEWSEEFPTCQSNMCEQPTLDDGTFSPNKLAYQVGDIVNFECAEGFILIGVTSVRCQIDGSWSERFPICRRVTCRPAPSIDYGSFTPVQRDYFPTNKVTFSCNDGFILYGQETIICLLSGKWSHPFPTCRQNQCDQPQRNPFIISIVPSQNSYSVGDTVTFRCRPGFDLVGSETSTCQTDGSWNPIEPRCRRVITCRPPTKPRYSIATPYKQIYQIGETITYSCRHGLILEGKSTIVCQNNGRFSPAPPTCKRPSKTCSRPFLSRFGSVEPHQDEYDAGTTITFLCDQPYVIDGANEATCQPNGQWSEIVPSCKFGQSHSCKNRCKETWDVRQPCQCSRFCKYVKGSCCQDYLDIC